jgi:hypothetical protein
MSQILRREDTADPQWRLRTRLTALVLTIVVGVLLAMTVRSWVIGAGSASTFALLFGPASVMLGIAALVHPPLLYVLGPRRPLLTKFERGFGTALVIVGVALGVALTTAWFGLW